MIRKILEHFFNTFNADDKYSRLNKDKLMQSIKMKLSKKQKNFSDLFSQFSNSRLKFEHFEKRDELQGSKRRG